MSYWKFEPTDDRDFTLHVNNGIAYRDTLPDEFDDKSADMLRDALELIADETKWMPTDFDVSDPMSWKHITAVDRLGNRCNPSCPTAVRWTLLGAIHNAYHRNYTPNSLRIALNAMQLTIEGWISLGYNHDDRRQQEQYGDIIGLDQYMDDDQERNGHRRCVDTLKEAITQLEALRRE